MRQRKWRKKKKRRVSLNILHTLSGLKKRKLDYYLTIKNEIIPFAATRMDPEIIILSEVQQRKTNTIWHYFFFFFFFFLAFLGLHLWYIEVPRLGLNQSCSRQPTPEPQTHQIQAALATYTTTHRVRDQTHILVDTSQVHYWWATMGTPP